MAPVSQPPSTVDRGSYRSGSPGLLVRRRTPAGCGPGVSPRPSPCRSASTPSFALRPAVRGGLTGRCGGLTGSRGGSTGSLGALTGSRGGLMGRRGGLTGSRGGSTGRLGGLTGSRGGVRAAVVV